VVLTVPKKLSIHIVISSTFTDILYYDIGDALSFSFPFPPSREPQESSTVTDMFYMSFMFLCNTFIFWFCLPHMKEDMWPFVFLNLTYLT
jgi:hypothetical protein